MVMLGTTLEITNGSSFLSQSWLNTLKSTCVHHHINRLSSKKTAGLYQETQKKHLTKFNVQFSMQTLSSFEVERMPSICESSIADIILNR